MKTSLPTFKTCHNKLTAIWHLVKKSGTVFLFLLALVLGGCSHNKYGSNDSKITVGVIFPLTGQYYDQGIHATNGIQLAKKKINENGGILGKELDVIVLNDRGDKAYTMGKYRLLKEKGVVAIIAVGHGDIAESLEKMAKTDGISLIVLNLPIQEPTLNDNINSSELPPLHDVAASLLVEQYLKYFSQRPTESAKIAYAGLNKLAEAIQSSRSVSRNEITTALETRYDITQN